jgi:4-hydroxy-4-methyl-2-oxoglutarate aldolase
MKTQKLSFRQFRLHVCIVCIILTASAFNNIASAQLYNFTEEQMINFTKANPYGRFPGGRPKIPDAVLDSIIELQVQIVEAVGVIGRMPASSGATANLNGNTIAAGAAPAGGRAGAAPAAGGRGGGTNAWSSAMLYETGWKMLQPGKHLYGRAMTVQFMPSRPDLVAGMQAEAAKNKFEGLNNTFTLNQLQKGDVVVCDLYGKVQGGTYVGDKLAYFVWKTTGTGMVVDGGIYLVENMARSGMQAFYRDTYPGALSGATVSGVNIPIHIGNAVVMPGDLIIGDNDGILAVPPQFVPYLVTQVIQDRRRDTWIKAAFDLKRYKSNEIYGQPRDPVLLKQFNDYKATGDPKYLPK